MKNVKQLTNKNMNKLIIHIATKAGMCNDYSNEGSTVWLNSKASVRLIKGLNNLGVRVDFNNSISVNDYYLQTHSERITQLLKALPDVIK